MSLHKKIYLDANVLIEMIEGAGPQAQLLIELFAMNDGTRSAYLFTSELTLAEVLVAPFMHNRGNLIQTYDNVLNNPTVLEVGPVDRDVLPKAAFIRSLYQTLKLPDAIHIATAFSQKCTHFHTADLRIRNTLDLPQLRTGTGESLSQITVIRPDQATLETLILESAV